MYRRNRGYITVEASIIIPLFLFFMLAMAGICMTLMAEAHIHQALASATDYSAQHCYLKQKLSGTQEAEKPKDNGIDIEKLMDMAVIKKQFVTYLGEDFYVERMISGGREGILVTVKKDKKNSKIMLVTARYQVNLQIPLLGTYSLSLSNQIKQKAFVGFSKEECNNNDCYVFITPNREAYHMRRDCTHLQLEVRSVSAYAKHNYDACYYCGKRDNIKTYYISKSGGVYHTSRDCVGLKRTVRRVKQSSVKGVGACERCGG